MCDSPTGSAQCSPGGAGTRRQEAQHQPETEDPSALRQEEHLQTAEGQEKTGEGDPSVQCLVQSLTDTQNNHRQQIMCVTFLLCFSL